MNERNKTKRNYTSQCLKIARYESSGVYQQNVNVH